MQAFYTVGDAIDIAVQKRHTESTSTSSKLKVMSKSKDKRSTKNKNTFIHTPKSNYSQELRNKADRCLELLRETQETEKQNMCMSTHYEC